MKYFSVIIGLIFFISVFANGCDKGESTSEPNVKDAAKTETEMEEPAEALEEIKEKAEEVLEETVQQVKVVGVKTSFSLNEALSGDIKNMYYEGALVLETSNGEEVEALCDTSLIKNIKGGQMLEIEFDKELDS